MMFFLFLYIFLHFLYAYLSRCCNEVSSRHKCCPNIFSLILGIHIVIFSATFPLYILHYFWYREMWRYWYKHMHLIWTHIPTDYWLSKSLVLLLCIFRQYYRTTTYTSCRILWELLPYAIPYIILKCSPKGEGVHPSHGMEINFIVNGLRKKIV